MSEVIQRTANGVDVISLDTFNCDRRTLCIRGEITQESAFEFALTAEYLNSLSETEAITVYINSPGGDIDAGLLMYDVIQWLWEPPTAWQPCCSPAACTAVIFCPTAS